jgi:hypothetical protein
MRTFRAPLRSAMWRMSSRFRWRSSRMPMWEAYHKEPRRWFAEAGRVSRNHFSVHYSCGDHRNVSRMECARAGSSVT